MNTHKTASSPKEKEKERAGGRKRERREEGKEANPTEGKIVIENGTVEA